MALKIPPAVIIPNGTNRQLISLKVIQYLTFPLYLVNKVRQYFTYKSIISRFSQPPFKASVKGDS